MSGSYQTMATAAAQKYGVPTQLFLAQIGQESAWNPSAVGPTTRYGTPVGLGQFMPGTATRFNIDPYDPAQSLDAAAKYDAQLYKTSGSWISALKAYGTLPGSGTYSAGQKSVADIAAGLDSGTPPAASSSGIGGGMSPSTSSSTSTGSASGSGSGWLAGAWEIVLRGSVFFAGLCLVLLALFAALVQNKTVQTTASMIGKVGLT